MVGVRPRTERDDAVELFASGARGRASLLGGRFDGGESLAIRDVAVGGTAVDPLVVDTLVHARDEPDECRLDRLTARELQVLALLAEGLSNASIAERPWLTKRAVEKHIGEIFARLDLHDNPDVSRRVTATLLFLREAGMLVRDRFAEQSRSPPLSAYSRGGRSSTSADTSPGLRLWGGTSTRQLFFMRQKT